MAFPLFENIHEEQGPNLRCEAPWGKSLRELTTSEHTRQSTEKSGFIRSTMDRLGHKRGKNPQNIQLSLKVVHQTDNRSLDNTAWSAPSEFQPDPQLQASAYQIDGFEPHLTVPEGSGAAGNTPQCAQSVSPTGSTDWDWESPARIPKYDTTYKPGNLRRRNALHRASAHAKAAFANSSKKFSIGDRRLERHGPGSIDDEPIDIVRHARSSWGEDSTYCTSSSRSSILLNEMPGSFPPERRRRLDPPNPDDELATDLRHALGPRNRRPVAPQLKDSRQRPLEIVPVSPNSMTRTSPSDVRCTFLDDADLRSEEQLLNDHTWGPDIHIRSQLNAVLAHDQETSDRELGLQLQQEEEEEEQRKQQERSRTKTCIICTDDLDVLDFHVKPPTSECDHSVETCHKCLQLWVASEFDSNGWEHIKCPQCPQLLSYADMQAAADPEVFNR